MLVSTKTTAGDKSGRMSFYARGQRTVNSVKSAAQPKPQNRDLLRVGRSRIQGKGVFAKRKIPRGTRIVEYLGERISTGQLLIDMANGERTHTYVFAVSPMTVIDGARGGSDARFINHSCEPNCEAYVFDDRVYIYAMRDITRGEELTFDYQLGPAIARKGRRSKSELEAYRCNCGSPKCRGTMIARKRR